MFEFPEGTSWHLRVGIKKYNRENEMIPGAVHRSPGICVSTEENPGKSQLGDFMMKVLRPVIASNEHLSPN